MNINKSDHDDTIYPIINQALSIPEMNPIIIHHKQLLPSILLDLMLYHHPQLVNLTLDYFNQLFS